VEYWTAMLCVAFGIGMELLQGMMHAGRQFEYLDILADIIGVLIAFWVYSRYLKKQYHGSQ
jgi:VanZ family protein